MTATIPEPSEATASAALGSGPTQDEAEWIRANVWTGAMRKTHRELPEYYRRCACQSGLSTWCGTRGTHRECRRAKPLPSPHTYIVSRGGYVASFREPYEHKHQSATGWNEDYSAMVWLADRVCRWQCPCGCHSAPAPPPHPVQLDLFGLVNA